MKHEWEIITNLQISIYMTDTVRRGVFMCILYKHVWHASKAMCMCVCFVFCVKGSAVVTGKVHSTDMCLWVLLLVVSKQMWSLVCNRRNIMRDFDVNLLRDVL
jgi:hypothetical protein